MDKQALKARMLAMEEAELAHAREVYADHIAEARLAANEPHENDQISQAEFAGELAEAFDHPVQAHAEKLQHLTTVNFDPKSEIAEGAVVRLGDRWFVIAISTTRFEFEGLTMMGISTMAPIYRALEGLAAGETVVFNGREMEIAEVL